MTTLEEATQKILHALREQNFEDLSAALEERARLIASGVLPTQAAWQIGETACEGLTALKQRLATESSRLEQMRAGVQAGAMESPTTDPAHVDFRG